MDEPRLTPEQEQLLVALVEAWRELPPAHRASFRSIAYDGGHDHPNLMLTRPSQFSMQVYIGDIEELHSAAFVKPDYGQHGLRGLRITNAGFQRYEMIQSRRAETAANVEEAIRTYISSATAVQRCPEAYRKLRLAEERLWSPTAEEHLREIGSNCREALQAFASCWVARVRPPGVEDDAEKTINRLKAVAAAAAPHLGERERMLLERLTDYVGAVNGMIQRQLHGTKDPVAPVTWRDARRCVFQTCMLFHEFDDIVGSAYPVTGAPAA